MKFFLSSTYRDLIEDRSVAISTLQGMLGLTKEKATGEIVAMEFFGASENNPLNECLQLISSSDLVIGIYGENYGSIDESTGLSLTELEFDKAVECTIPILCFVKKMEIRENREEKFIKEKILGNDRVVAFYSDSNELADKLNDSLKAYFCSLEGYSYNSLWDIVVSLKKELSLEQFHMLPFLDGEEEKAIETILDGARIIREIGEDLKKENDAIFDYAYCADCYPEQLNSTLSNELQTNLIDVAGTVRNNWVYLYLGIPNWSQQIEISARFLQLRFLQTRLLTEPWTEELRTDVLKIRDTYCDVVKDAFYYD